MDETPSPQPQVAPQPVTPAPLATPPVATIIYCPVCHLPVSPDAYFCSNCGAKIKSPALSTSIFTQIWIYIFSAILPVIFYLAITKWPGITYMKSHDVKTKQIGIIAMAILIISSIVVFWASTVWIDGFLQSATSSINGTPDLTGL